MTYTTRFGKLVKLRKTRKGAHHFYRVPADPTRQTEPAMPADKGLYNGACNRSACLQPGASWYNHSTRKYYCTPCASWLNSDPFNQRDAMEIFGHELCTHGRPQPKGTMQIQDANGDFQTVGTITNLTFIPPPKPPTFNMTIIPSPERRLTEEAQDDRDAVK